MNAIKKGRGAQLRVANRFNKHRVVLDVVEPGMGQKSKTSYQEVFPKTIVNKVDSPDVGMMYSLNPYQGCEHGCIYCYARNTHEYWGYGIGLDFEQRVLYKRTAPRLLEDFITKPNWEAAPIVLSGNTDCYQPAEREFRITRQLLEVFLKYRHPVGIITKNALILRDIDILQDLAKNNLVHVTITVTSLNEAIRRKLEPRTASAKKKLMVMDKLSSAGVPVQLMMGPIVPGLNSYEMFDVVKAASEHGALDAVYTLIRLNGQLGKLFTDWIEKAFPLKAEHVLNLIKQCHKGKLNDSRWRFRMRGDGKIAEMISRQFKLAKAIHLRNRQMPALNLNLHNAHKPGQLNLF